MRPQKEDHDDGCIIIIVYYDHSYLPLWLDDDDDDHDDDHDHDGGGGGGGGVFLYQVLYGLCEFFIQYIFKVWSDKA